MTRRAGMPASTTRETKYLDVSHVGPPEENVRELYVRSCPISRAASWSWTPAAGEVSSSRC